jgi:hypothetical protein
MKRKDTFFKISLLLFSIIILVACGTMTIEKRKHSRGYYVHFNQKSAKGDQDDVKEVRKDPKSQTASKENTITGESFGSLHTKSDTIYSNEAGSVPKIEEQPLKVSAEIIKGDQDNVEQIGSSRSGNQDIIDQTTVDRINPLLLTLIFIFPFIIAFKGVNPKWVKWTREYPVKARWFLIASSIVAFVVATLIGSVLRFPFSPSIAVIGIAGLILSVISYFSFNRSENDTLRRGGKYFGITMFRTSALFMTFGIGGSNVTLSSDRMKQWDFFTGALSLPQDDGGYYYSDGEIAGLVVLGLVVLLGILYLTAIWSCNLSCSGNDAAAIAVLAGGTFLAVFLSFLIFFNAFKRTDTEAGEISKKALIAGLIGMAVMCIFLLLTYGN